MERQGRTYLLDAWSGIEVLGQPDSAGSTGVWSIGNPKFFIIKVVHEVVQCGPAVFVERTGRCLAKWPQGNIRFFEENAIESFLRIENLLLLVAGQKGSRSRTVSLTGVGHRGGVCCWHKAVARFCQPRQHRRESSQRGRKELHRK